MLKEESACVDCGLPCLGTGCPYYKIKVYVCDFCEIHEAQYQIDGNHLCEKCAEEYLDDQWQSLCIEEKAEALNLDCHNLD